VIKIQWGSGLKDLLQEKDFSPKLSERFFEKRFSIFAWRPLMLRDRTGVEYVGNHLGETKLRWLGQLERMDETNLVKRVREERIPGHIKRGRPKKSWNEVVKEDMQKRGLCINDAQDRNKRK